MKSILIGIVCFLFGLGLGIWLSVNKEANQAAVTVENYVSRQSDEGLSEASPQDSGSVADTSDQMEPEPVVFGVVAASSPKQVTVSTSLIEILSQREGNRTMGQALLDTDGAIEQALEISDQEKTVIETSWERTKQKIQELEARLSTVEEMEDLSVRITLPDISPQMSGLSEQFSLSVQDTLGQNRGEVFLAAKQINQLIAKSAQQRTYTITAESPREGEWRFNMTMESPEGRRVWVGDSIPEEIRHLTDAAQILPRISDLPE